MSPNPEQTTSAGHAGPDSIPGELLGAVPVHAFTKWPDTPSLDPHEIQTVRGWHCVEEFGRWDIERLSADLSETLVHSQWSGPLTVNPPNKRRCRHLVFANKSEVFIGYVAHGADWGWLRVWAHSAEQAKVEFARLHSAYFQEAQRDAQAHFFVLTMRMGELDAHTITIPATVHTSEDLRLHYGDDFEDWHRVFVTELNSRQQGLTILQGPPGTGKTTYLRHLVYQLRKTHRFYYLPLPVYPLLSSTAGIDFWIGENEKHASLKKVVVLEDAEALLAERQADNRESLSTLLNIGDGFLGDVLQMQVICTMNAPVGKLDPALKRSGRLIAARQFERLTWLEAERLARAKGLDLKCRDSYSLAEIYANSHLTADLTRDCEHKIGFAA